LRGALAAPPLAASALKPFDGKNSRRRSQRRKSKKKMQKLKNHD